MAALRQHDELRADLDRRVDQFHGRFFLPVRVAREHAEIGGLETVGPERPALAGGVQDPCGGGDRLRVFLDLDRRHHGKYVRLFDIHRDVDLVLVGHPLDPVLELVRRDAERAAGLGGALRCLVKLVRDQARLEHAVPRHRDEAGDVDTHRADERAAAADRAAVVQQVLPFLELLDRHRLLEAEQPVEERERSRFPLVGLLEQLDLPDRRIPGIVRAHVEVTGIGAHAAMQATVQVGGRLRIEVLHEMMHRLLDALFRAHVTLNVVANLRRLVSQSFGFPIHGVSSVDCGHVRAPLRSNTMPVVPRVTNTRKVCPSLPKGSQIISTTTERMWIASSVS